MSSSPVCTCGVCPAHGPAAGHGADHPGGAGWAGPVRRYLESVVEWLDGPEAMGAGHGELEARLQVHSREQYRLEQPRVFRTGFLLVLCYFLAVQPSVVNFLRCAVSES
jgi:hypothetical protein